MAATKTIEFSTWPTWNFQFPEKDLMIVRAVRYWPAGGGERLELPEGERWRLAISINGVSVLHLFRKNTLPKLAERADAVVVEYEP